MSLHEAIGRGNGEVAAPPFEDGAAVNTKDANGDTPLHISARKGNTLTTQLLVNMGADLNSRDGMQRTPLYCAAVNGHALVGRILAEAGAELTLPGGYEKDTPLHRAATEGNLGTTQLLMNMGADLNSRDGRQRTPLYCAAINGHDLVGRILAEAGAELTLPGGYEKDTPLHVAATKGNLGTTQLLMNMGADLNSRDGRQRTPLYCAAINGHALVVGVLMEAGADLNLPGRDYGLELTPLTAAVARGRERDSDGQLEVIRMMIEFGGVDVNFPDEGGATPLHWNCPRDPCVFENKYLEKIKVLVAAGANLEARDSDGRTPLNACVDWVYPEYIRTLLSHGADANTLDNEGNTPLHRVVGEVFSGEGADYPERVELLLKAGADETMLDGTGQTAAERLEEGLTRQLYDEDTEDFDEINRIFELLENAPIDRRWWRRGLLLMCIARHRKGEEWQLLGDSCAGGTNDGWAHVAAWVLDVGLEVGTGGIFRMIVEYL